METHERGQLLRARFIAIGGHLLSIEHKPKANTAPLVTTARHYGPFYGVSLYESRCQWVSKTATKEISKARGALGFNENKTAAQSGGTVAGNARKDLEKQLGHSVISKENNLNKLGPSRDLMKLPGNFEEAVKRIAPKQD